jgi:1-acyl-sn-glycerol-3-phosphate acyltransferase
VPSAQPYRRDDGRDTAGDDLAARDAQFIERVALPAFTFLRQYYFRAELEGGEHLPASGPFMTVANHNGGPIMPDVWVLASYWWSLLGTARPAYAMVHDAALAIPGLGTFLRKVGGVRASRENAARALRAGAPILVYPGGELDALKSFRRRNRVDFRGRKGFIRLAVALGVPIVPVVSAGGHEVYVTLLSSERLARWSGLARLARVKTVPVNLGLPWGIWVSGFVPYLPLPAKLTYRVGRPIVVGPDPEAAADDCFVGEVYRHVTCTMQRMLDDLTAHRRFPVLGCRLMVLAHPNPAPRPPPALRKSPAPQVPARALPRDRTVEWC